ncbi:unnamed protein product [Urochloa humidicola]
MKEELDDVKIFAVARVRPECCLAPILIGQHQDGDGCSCWVLSRLAEPLCRCSLTLFVHAHGCRMPAAKHDFGSMSIIDAQSKDMAMYGSLEKKLCASASASVDLY